MKNRNENSRFIFDNPICYNYTYYKKYVLLILRSFVYKTIFRFILTKPTHKKKYKYSICSCFKNEGPYLKEFIEYHLLIGFEHFYFYNNNSEDNYNDILKEYIEGGIVTLIDWPSIPVQLASYEHWYSTYRHETQWVSFLDIDEFICPTKVCTINEWIKPFERYPIIMMYWRMFGTSGIIETDTNKLVTEQYFNSWNKLTNIGKLLINTDYDINTYVGFWHFTYAKYKSLFVPPINQYGYFVRDGIHRYNEKEDEIQVNHYWSKSYENYIQKHRRGSSAFGKSWKTFDAFLYHEHFNISCDYKIFRFLTQLKLKMREEYPDVTNV